MVKLKHTWMSVEMKLMFRGGFEGLVGGISGYIYRMSWIDVRKHKLLVLSDRSDSYYVQNFD